MIAKQQWIFKPRFRSKAYGWKGSSLAVERLKEAVSEIKKDARTDARTAADGAVSLFERFWPAFQHIDTSSGALGGAVNWTQAELLPLIVAAPTDRKMRDKWLNRLWQAIQDDGVDYLCVVEEHWGELCGSSEIATQWADRFVDLIRMAWSDARPGGYVRGTSLCLSSLLAARRHQEIWNLSGNCPVSVLALSEVWRGCVSPGRSGRGGPRVRRSKPRIEPAGPVYRCDLRAHLA